MNVALTYLEMSVASGMSEREAIARICEEVGLKFSASYVSGWKDNSRAIPPKALLAMQIKAASYAAKKAGIKTTAEKATHMAKLLGPSIKK